MSLYDPRSPWPGPPPLAPPELVDIAKRTQHVHVSIMDWMLDLLPALAATGRPVSTDLHDWDGLADVPLDLVWGLLWDLVLRQRHSAVRCRRRPRCRSWPLGSAVACRSDPGRAGRTAASKGLACVGHPGDRRHPNRSSTPTVRATHSWPASSPVGCAVGSRTSRHATPRRSPRRRVRTRGWSTRLICCHAHRPIPAPRGNGSPRHLWPLHSPLSGKVHRR